METRELTCIQCPIGCALTVTIDGDAVHVTGNSCPRGEAYGKKEVTAPTRTVTSTARVRGGELPRVSVKTRTDIPKEAIFPVMEAIRALELDAPIQIGQTVLPDAAGTGVDIIATKSVEKE